jgi:hypothetical protein
MYYGLTSCWIYLCLCSCWFAVFITYTIYRDYHALEQSHSGVDRRHMILSDEWMSGLHCWVSVFKLTPVWSFFISHSVILHVLAGTCLHCLFVEEFTICVVVYMPRINYSHIKQLNLRFSGVNCLIGVECTCV